MALQVLIQSGEQKIAWLFSLFIWENTRNNDPRTLSVKPHKVSIIPGGSAGKGSQLAPAESPLVFWEGFLQADEWLMQTGDASNILTLGFSINVPSRVFLQI